jgi:hypothetical protein
MENMTECAAGDATSIAEGAADSGPASNKSESGDEGHGNKN